MRYRGQNPRWVLPRYAKQNSRGQSLKNRDNVLRWLCVLALIGCAVPLRLVAATKIGKHRTVVVISLDGFPAYALDNPKLPIPTLRKLAREGAVATSMRPVNPTVTWPNHTAIVTGVEPAEHQVLYNGLMLRSEGGAKPLIEPWRDKEAPGRIGLRDRGGRADDRASGLGRDLSSQNDHMAIPGIA